MKITVSRNELQAALLFASTDDSRYTLNSVCIQVRKRKTPILVGTDGRRLAVINTVAAQAEGEEFTDDHELLLTAEFVRAICSLSKALGGGLHTWICFEHVTGSQRLSLAFIGVEFCMVAEKNAPERAAIQTGQRCCRRGPKPPECQSRTWASTPRSWAISLERPSCWAHRARRCR